MEDEERPPDPEEEVHSNFDIYVPAMNQSMITQP
jgi:hypothetical protein